jgi:branched-chain amino acid transport system permease protein
MGSLGGAVLGAIFVTLFPYAIEAVMLRVLGAGGFAASAFALNYAVFGAVMILFLMYEPQGLIGIARRLRQLLSPRGARR